MQWFLDGMPEPYAAQHGMLEIRAHAEIVSRRALSLVHLEICPRPADADSGEWICVVTDDQPGLLSLLSAAIAAHSLDVIEARVYCRARPGRPNEAVDLFSVRRLRQPSQEPLTQADLAAIQTTMAALLRGETAIERLEQHAAKTSRPDGRPDTAVYFHSAEPDLLLIETPDHPGLLLEITLTIFRDGLARDEFHLAEIDGTPLTEARRDLVIDKVRQAVGSKG